MFAAFRSLRRPSADAAPKERVRLSRHEIGRLFAYLRPYSRQMLVASVTSLLAAGLGLVFPWVIQSLVDTILNRGDLSALNQITVALLLTFLLRSILTYFQVYELTYAGERIVADLRSQTYAHLHNLSLRFFTNRRTGELISRLSSDVTLVRSALTNNVAAVISQTLTFIGSLVLMLVLNWRLSLFILVLAPLIVASAFIFGMRLRKLAEQVQDTLAESTAQAEEALSAVRVVKAFNRQSYEAGRYTAAIEKTFAVTMQMTRVRAAFGPLVAFLGFGALGGILWFGGREVLAGRLTGGALIAFLVYGINIAGALGAFTGLYTQLEEALGASRRIFDLLDEQPDIIDAPNALDLPAVRGDLRFEQVSFRYEPAQSAADTPAGADAAAPVVASPHVLQDITLEVQPGEVLALVGPSGAGKSTLFNLIPRFYDPTGGQILLDGHDLRQIKLNTLYAQIGLVPQETQLFSGSVRDNLRYGRLDASDSELADAARAANAEEFIQRLPDGYDTLVGERGVKLSGGQRQRIAIARALLKNPRILLLDEATSSLDSESEGLVQQALERLMQNRTTVIIAHRLSTVHKADRIAVLEQGRLVEIGTHSDLLAKEGLYARLYRLQFRPE